jgi:hypothetical protein
MIIKIIKFAVIIHLIVLCIKLPMNNIYFGYILINIFAKKYKHNNEQSNQLI